ncbi:MAG TPA: histidinol-phosphatase [Terriglobia bacterium]|nr:histidinol-phosphatase [Terriglobia bacterium]
MNPQTSSTRLTEPEIRRYLDFACRLGELAGEAILPHFRAALEVGNKDAAGGYDPVTIADRAAEEAISREISRAYPEHSIHGEELGRSRGVSPLTWVIDPIDGTRSFILGQLHWGTLIALNDGSRPVLGVMHQPYVPETFVGSPLGAFERRAGRERPLRTRTCASLREAVVCTSHPDLFARSEERAAFELVASKARLSRFGGDCYNYCLLAAGLIDLVIESSLHAYDVQALIPIIEAAGGRMTGWDGQPCYEGGAVVATGDPSLHHRVLEMLDGDSR